MSFYICITVCSVLLLSVPAYKPSQEQCSIPTPWDLVKTKTDLVSNVRTKSLTQSSISPVTNTRRLYRSTHDWPFPLVRNYAPTICTTLSDTSLTIQAAPLHETFSPGLVSRD